MSIKKQRHVQILRSLDAPGTKTKNTGAGTTDLPQAAPQFMNRSSACQPDQLKFLPRTYQPIAQLIIEDCLRIVTIGFGMFGLSSQLLSQRTHEIGIRKILGASPAGIFWPLSKEFVYTVVMAAALATPLTYLIADRWYESVRVYLPPLTITFLSSILLILGIMLVTIFYQTITATNSNPVQAVRYTKRPGSTAQHQPKSTNAPSKTSPSVGSAGTSCSTAF